MQAEREKHVLYIDILKAIACICVLVGHVIGGIVKANIYVSNVLSHLCAYVYLFHVPCFFFASGYLYANKQIENGKEYVLFVAKKMLILGLPYLVCTVCYVAMSFFFSSEMNSNTYYSFGALINIWREPIAQYWYLYALLIMFMVIPAIELILKNVNKKYLFMAFILLALFGRSNISCINYIIQYAYLFYMGVIWDGLGGGKWKSDLLRHTNCAWGGVYGIEGIVIYLIYVIIGKESILLTRVSVILQCAVTLLLVITMIRVSFVISENKTYIKAFLLWISKYSFYIYLFHTWFSGTCRVFLRKAGITNCWIQTFAGMIVGLIGPVLIAKVVKKVPIFLFWIEPLTIIRRSNQRISNYGGDEE